MICRNLEKSIKVNIGPHGQNLQPRPDPNNTSILESNYMINFQIRVQINVQNLKIRSLKFQVNYLYSLNPWFMYNNPLVIIIIFQNVRITYPRDLGEISLQNRLTLSSLVPKVVKSAYRKYCPILNTNLVVKSAHKNLLH